MARMTHLVTVMKRETVFATYSDPDPATAADVVVFRDVDVQAANADVVERPRLLPYHGHTGAHGFVRRRMELTGSVPVSLSGTAGTAPPVGKLLRACGLAETITAGTRVDYTPVSGPFEFYSVGYFLDGTRHRGTGMRGSFTLTLEAGQEPQLGVTLMGVMPDEAAVALPTATYTAWRDPTVVRADDTIFQLGGNSLPLQRLVYTHGNTLVRRDLSSTQDVRITGRAPRLEVTFQAPDALSPFNPFAMARNGSLTTAAVTHSPVGLPAGDIFQADFFQLWPEPGVRYVADGDVAMITMAFRVRPTLAGNDEMRLRFR